MCTNEKTGKSGKNLDFLKKIQKNEDILKYLTFQ